MPYKSDKQRKFFEMCLNSPESVKGGTCPPRKVLQEYHNATYRRKKRGDPKYR